jgi:hypothetical protein
VGKDTKSVLLFGLSDDDRSDAPFWTCTKKKKLDTVTRAGVKVHSRLNRMLFILSLTMIFSSAFLASSTFFSHWRSHAKNLMNLIAPINSFMMLSLLSREASSTFWIAYDRFESMWLAGMARRSTPRPAKADGPRREYRNETQTTISKGLP